MKYIIIITAMFSFMHKINAQNTLATAQINGTYHLLFVERDGAKNKIIQLAENNGTKMLAVTACSNCFPALYTYEKEESDRLGKPIFFNKMGLYVITYDAESFIIVMLSTKEGENFSYLNFYSKNPTTVKNMTKDKIEAYALTQIMH